MSTYAYAILQSQQGLQFVQMPDTHLYQLTALHQRLHKELDKLTACELPDLPVVLAECRSLELISAEHNIHQGLEYINQLKQSFASIPEKSYPLISLFTEIRALQAQLEQWYEEEDDME
ncbi:hydrolase/acyltransferase [Paenibacillus larvae]